MHINVKKYLINSILYYKHSIPHTCFGHSFGLLQWRILTTTKITKYVLTKQCIVETLLLTYVHWFTNVSNICNIRPEYSWYTSLRMAIRMAETCRRNTAFVLWLFLTFMCICLFRYHIFQIKLCHRDILPLCILKNEAVSSFETS